MADVSFQRAEKEQPQPKCNVDRQLEELSAAVKLTRIAGPEAGVDSVQASVGSRSRGTLTQICITRGFRNFYYYRLAAYLKAGELNLQAPRLLPN